MMTKFFLIILLDVFPVAAVELEYLLENVYANISCKAVIETLQEIDACILDRIHTSGYVIYRMLWAAFRH